MWKHIFFSVILFPQLSFNILTVESESEILIQLQDYLNYIWNCSNRNEIVLIVDRNWETKSVVDWFLTKTDIVYLINEEKLQSICRQIVSRLSFYIFAESREKVMEYIYTVNASYVYTPTFFIILHTENQKRRNETDLLEDIWKIFKFLNCLLVTVEKSIQVTTFNPFFNETIVFHKKKHLRNCEILPDKLNDLNGYEIRVSLFEDPPRVIVCNGKFEGEDIRFMYLAFKKINASAQIIIPDQNEGSYFSGANIGIVARQIDISFMKHFTTRIIGRNVSYSYPHGMDDFVVVVLRASQNENFFGVHEIFDYYTWVCVVISIFTVTFYRKVIVKRDANIFSSFMHVWSIFTGVTLDSTLKTQKKVKIVFLVWTVGCLVLNIIFSSLLASKIIKPRSGNNIDTIEELQKLNPKIYMSKKFFGNIPKEYGISNNLISASHLTRHEALNNIDENTAVVIATTVLELIVDRSHLHVLREHLLPGFTMYRFQSKSPFKEKINEILFKTIEHGLIRFNRNFTVRHDHHQHSNKQQLVLKFKHLKNIFLIFAFGQSIAVIVFLLEIIAKFYQKRTYIYTHYLD